MDHFFSLYCICYNIASVLCFGFVAPEACGVLALWPGIEPAPPALEGEVLTTGPPGKSRRWLLFKNNNKDVDGLICKNTVPGKKYREQVFSG